MSKISIIVPVYNVEKYLEKCIDSILNQTFTDLEILLIDDGSKDKSGEICDRYAKKDDRIRVIHKDNGGLSSARNCGIEHASSPYLGFVDSDDYIKKDMYEVLYDEIQKDNFDIAMCDLFHCYEDKIVKSDKKEEKLILNSEQAIKMVMEAKKTSVTAVNKLYKKEIFDSIRYPEGKLSEDAFVIVEILMKAKKIVFTSRQEYYYVHRKNSITTSKFKEKDLNVIEAYKKNLHLIEKNYPCLIDVGVMRYLWAHFYVLDKMMLTQEEYDKQIENKVIKVLRENCMLVLRDERFNFTRKVSMILLMVNKQFYKICVKLKKKKYLD